eukprot:gene1148-4367_t
MTDAFWDMSYTQYFDSEPSKPPELSFKPILQNTIRLHTAQKGNYQPLIDEQSMWNTSAFQESSCTLTENVREVLEDENFGDDEQDEASVWGDEDDEDDATTIPRRYKRKRSLTIEVTQDIPDGLDLLSTSACLYAQRELEQESAGKNFQNNDQTAHTSRCSSISEAGCLSEAVPSPIEPSHAARQPFFGVPRRKSLLSQALKPPTISKNTPRKVWRDLPHSECECDQETADTYSERNVSPKMGGDNSTTLSSSAYLPQKKKQLNQRSATDSRDDGNMRNISHIGSSEQSLSLQSSEVDKYNFETDRNDNGSHQHGRGSISDEDNEQGMRTGGLKQHRSTLRYDTMDAGQKTEYTRFVAISDDEPLDTKRPKLQDSNSGKCQGREQTITTILSAVDKDTKTSTVQPDTTLNSTSDNTRVVLRSRRRDTPPGSVVSSGYELGFGVNPQMDDIASGNVTQDESSSQHADTPGTATGSVFSQDRGGDRRRKRKRMKDLPPDQRERLREINRMAAQKHRESLRVRESSIKKLIELEDERKKDLDVEIRSARRELRTLYRLVFELYTSGRLLSGSATLRHMLEQRREMRRQQQPYTHHQQHPPSQAHSQLLEQIAKQIPDLRGQFPLSTHNNVLPFQQVLDPWAFGVQNPAVTVPSVSTGVMSLPQNHVQPTSMSGVWGLSQFRMPFGVSSFPQSWFTTQLSHNT